MLYETPNPHGGEVYARKIDLDFSANINPYGTPQAVKDAVFGTKRRQGALETMTKQAARTAGSKLGNQILRGVLGGIFKK